MTFLNPLDTLIPKTPFSFFCQILGPPKPWFAELVSPVA